MFDTWTCHVCGEERPDERISVYSETTITKSGIKLKQNVRYCNDRPACLEGAPGKINRSMGETFGREMKA